MDWIFEDPIIHVHPDLRPSRLKRMNFYETRNYYKSTMKQCQLHIFSLSSQQIQNVYKFLQACSQRLPESHLKQHKVLQLGDLQKCVVPRKTPRAVSSALWNGEIGKLFCTWSNDHKRVHQTFLQLYMITYEWYCNYRPQTLPACQPQWIWFVMMTRLAQPFLQVHNQRKNPKHEEERRLKSLVHHT